MADPKIPTAMWENGMNGPAVVWYVAKAGTRECVAWKEGVGGWLRCDDAMCFFLVLFEVYICSYMMLRVLFTCAYILICTCTCFHTCNCTHIHIYIYICRCIFCIQWSVFLLFCDFIPNDLLCVELLSRSHKGSQEAASWSYQNRFPNC